MNEMLVKLKEYGCDVDGALARVIDDVELYAYCLKTLVEDSAFVDLGKALKANDIDKAFDYAHTIKGVSANLGLTPLYDLDCEIVEVLRKKENNDLLPRYEKLLAIRNEISDIIK